MTGRGASQSPVERILQNTVEGLAYIYGLWYSQVKPGGHPHHETNLNPKDPLNPPGAPTLLNLLQPLTASAKSGVLW